LQFHLQLCLNSSPTLIHSSTNLTSILKDTNLSVLPKPIHADYAMYGGSKTGMLPPSSSSSGSPRNDEDLSWAILPTYTNGAFRQSADTLVDSGFYRAGEAVDNVSEFYHRPAGGGGGGNSSDYVTYQNLGLKPPTAASNMMARAIPVLADDSGLGGSASNASAGGRPTASMMMMMAARGDVSDNGTGTTSSTDCEHSETCSDKNLPPSFNRHHLTVDAASRAATAEFHSLIVTGDGWSHHDGGDDIGGHLSVSGPLSLPAYDLEKRRRRESFV
jgi:hypothetical protein